MALNGELSEKGTISNKKTSGYKHLEWTKNRKKQTCKKWTK